MRPCDIDYMIRFYCPRPTGIDRLLHRYRLPHQCLPFVFASSSLVMLTIWSGFIVFALPVSLASSTSAFCLRSIVPHSQTPPHIIHLLREISGTSQLVLASTSCIHTGNKTMQSLQPWTLWYVYWSTASTCTNHDHTSDAKKVPVPHI